MNAQLSQDAGRAMSTAKFHERYPSLEQRQEFRRAVERADQPEKLAPALREFIAECLAEVRPAES